MLSYRKQVTPSVHRFLKGYYNVYEISHGHIFKIIVNIHVGSGSRKYSFYLFTADANLQFFANFRKSDGFVCQLKLMKIVTTASRTYLN